MKPSVVFAFLPLLFLLSCDVIAPGDEPVTEFPRLLDFTGDGAYDFQLDDRFTMTSDQPPSGASHSLEFYPRPGCFLLTTENRIPLQPGDTVGPANELEQFLNHKGYPYWSGFSRTLASARYNLIDWILTPGLRTDPEGEYIGLRIDTGAQARYGWIRVMANSCLVQGESEWRLIASIRGYAFGEPGEPIVVGEYPE